MSLTSRLNTILEKANNTTGEETKTVNEAVDKLIEGYGSGSGESFKYSGTNATLIDSYRETWTLDDTTFVKGETSSSSATRIKNYISQRYKSATFNMEDKDVIVVQKSIVTPTHAPKAEKKAMQIKFVNYYINIYSKEFTSTGRARTSQTLNINRTRYYSTQGNIYSNIQNYGIYMSPSTSNLSNNTDTAYIYIDSPNFNCRSYSSIETAANMKLITDCTFEWEVEVYFIDSGSTLIGNVYKEMDEILE